MVTQITLDKLQAWAKRRGFIYPSSEIYGGLANTYDYGPYGVALKENIRRLWWKKFIENRDDMYGIDSSIIINPEVWKASGHVENFADVMVEDTVNQKRYRADHIIEEYFEKKGKSVKVDGKTPSELGQMIKENNIKSPDGNSLTEPRKFSTLFETEIGIISGEKNKAYLRGEIAQGLFINFKNIIDSMHPKLPFGIGQTGKAFRNEITLGQFTHRTLEFDLMEFEYFFDPEKQEWNELFEYWKNEVHDFAKQLGLSDENLRFRPHEKFELSHYSRRTEDLEYRFPWGFRELFAVAYRTDFDLKNHEKHTGKDLKYTYPDGSKIVPHVIEPTFGLSRVATVLFFESFVEETLKNGKTRVVLKFSPSIAPVKFAIFPLQKDDKLRKLAKEIYKNFRKKYACEYDDVGNIGKMYRRQDEIGTPFCITIDYQSLDDKTVTIRDRDSMKQNRIKIDNLENYFTTVLD